MILLSVLLTLCFTFRVGHGVGLHGHQFHGLEEPDTSHIIGAQTIDEAWIEQPLDHFNPQDNRNWSMRYYENAALFKEGGPIVIMLGGEWEIGTGYLMTGLMYDIASNHNAMMYYTEHRYYGKSKPIGNTATANLQYLNVDQALADIAYFIETKKKEERLANSTVIVFGGSYSGSMAAWARLKYPHLIQGALASSAPVLSKVDFHEYYEVVAKSLRGHSQQCVDDIKAAFDEVDELLLTKQGPQKLQKYFNLCDVPDISSPNDFGYFTNTLAEYFAGVVQTDNVVNGQRKIDACCGNMTAPYLGSPLQRLARLVSQKDKCLDNNYNKFIKRYADEAWSATSDITRLWIYQTCAEFGNYQTTNSTKSIFGALFPLKFFTNMCVDLYGEYYDSDFLNTRVRRTNIMYGGSRPDLRKVIFTNGDVDPWHVLSILKDLNEDSPAILIKGSSHCRDLTADNPTDIQDLVEARAKVRKIIGSWINSRD